MTQHVHAIYTILLASVVATGSQTVKGVIPEISMRDCAISTVPQTNRWECGFLTGNGNVGAIIPGSPYNESIVVCGKLYLPTGVKEIVPDLSSFKEEFKKAGLEAGIKGPAKVHGLMVEKSGLALVNTDPLHPACRLKIDALKQNSNLRNYRMLEDFKTGEVSVQWTDDQGDWSRHLFASRPDNTLVMLMRAPKGKLYCTLAMLVEHKDVQTESSSTADGWISTHNTYRKGKGGFDILMRVIPQGGTITPSANGVKIENADTLLLLMHVKQWRTPLPKEQSDAWATSPDNPSFKGAVLTNCLPEMKTFLMTLSDNYETLLASHIKIHGSLYNRVSLSLDSEADKHTPSETLLARSISEGKMPNAMAEQIYNAFRYLIICSSGDTPSNLQGIWTGTWNPAWSGDYTTDSNLQLEIQSLMSCNMPELMESYFKLIESWLPDWSLNAKKVYGFRGLVSNARGSNNCLLLHWGKQWPGEQCAIGLAGWMLHFFYDYYLFTGDQQFLRERFLPIAKGVALFYEDFLEGTEGTNGTYRFYMGYSPEHGLDANTTFDISTAKNVLKTLISACKILHCEQDNIIKWEGMLKKLPPYLINNAGELQEWSWPGAREDPNQRHHSHMLPLYQYCEFDKDLTPELWKAANLAFRLKELNWLKNEKNPNSRHITHGLMNQGQCAARLGRGDIVHEVLSKMAVRNYIYPGFMVSYWPKLSGYGFDPVGTTPDVINNAIIFGWDGKIDLLPALPKEWPKGDLRGVLLRGQIHVQQIQWDMSTGDISLDMTSGKDQTVLLRLPEGFSMTNLRVNENSINGNSVSLTKGNRTLIILKMETLKKVKEKKLP
ncbi:MAG: glycoside hydrolase N-terminal domain-containing protein [bacterium]